MSEKTSDAFKNAIKSYLDKRAESDEMFSRSYSKSGKNIDECCKYIVQEVQKLKVCGLSDEEVYCLAVHYYDEDDLGTIKEVKCQVVVNHSVELTDEEKDEAKKNAIARYEAEKIASLRVKEQAQSAAPAKKPVQRKQRKEEVAPSLFSFDDETTK